MANWWESAPLAQAEKPTAGGNWWDAAPVVTAAEKGPQDDQYRRAAREDLQRSGTGSGRLQRQIMQGLTFGAADEIIAGAMTPFEMVRRGTFNPVEGYNYAKAREDLALEQDRSRDGLLGSVAEVGAGVATGVGAARAGLTAGRYLAPNAGLGARSLAGLADGAAYGAATGALTGSGEGRVTGALQGGVIGGVAGGVLPGVVAGVSRVASPITSNIAARRNPEGFAQDQVARAISESQQIIDDVAAAAREGQGVFTVADAMGNSGQRMLSTVTRNPGAGRTQAVEFLDGRQAEQGRRIAGSLDDAFGSSQTAASLERIQTAARRAEGNLLYGDARRQAGAVDPTAAIQKADDVLRPGINRVVSTPSAISDTSVQGAVSRARSFLTDGRSVLSNFDDVLAAKGEIDSLIERATSKQQRALIPIRDALDDALASASAPYAKARDAYRTASQGIEAIQTGRQAATRGRFEDTTAAFSGMSPVQQAGFRSGYGDVLTERVQNAAQGVNKARDFTSDAARAELPAFSRPGQAPLLDRRLGRENVMFETRNAAMGGSKTADNLADSASTGLSPEIFGNLLSGNWSGAARNLMSRASSGMTGNTAQVREKLAEILLSRGGSASQIGTVLQQSQSNADARRRIAELVMRGALGGGSAAPGALSIPSTSGR